MMSLPLFSGLSPASLISACLRNEVDEVLAAAMHREDVLEVDFSARPPFGANNPWAGLGGNRRPEHKFRRRCLYVGHK